MTLDAVVKDDGTLIAKAPQSFWGKQVKVTIQDEPLTSKPEPKKAIVSEASQLNQEHELTDFQTLLLHGPVMSDKQFENFQALRERFRVWIGN